MAKCGLMPPGLGPFIQLLLFLSCVGVLAYKFKVDTSGRSLPRFVFDSSKQFAGAAWMHVCNLMVAGVLGEVGSGGDACTWYFIEIMMDCTLGVFVEFKMLEMIRKALRASPVPWLRKLADDIEAPCLDEGTAPGSVEAGAQALSQSLMNSGKKQGILTDLKELYGKVNKLMYTKQIVSWLMVVTAMKFVMVALMLLLSPVLEAVTGPLLNPLDQSPTAKLVVVMVCTPCIMNGVQFWLQDNIFVDMAKSHDEGLKRASTLKQEAMG